MTRTLEERRSRQREIFDRTLRQNDSRSGGSLIRKQVSDQRYWLEIWDSIGDRVTRAHVDEIVTRAVEDVQRVSSGTVAYGWSGGKDSLALQIVMEAAGYPECVFVITDLEYESFLKWATDRMPDGCEVNARSEVNLHWLVERPEQLFPPDAEASAKWFAAVQHAGQADYIKRRNIDLMHLGRRSMDGNMTGKDGFTKSRRGNFYNPIRDWSHEDVLAVLHYHDIELPPIYRWPRGFQVGTGPWPARQFCRTVDHGWGEVFQIDPSIVRVAANHFTSAKQFLNDVV
jgi:3'-phosphoadenosine 5'-phosphosulfate sulfotransferase (PAPS reductase)/FAD synthetase